MNVLRITLFFLFATLLFIVYVPEVIQGQAAVVPADTTIVSEDELLERRQFLIENGYLETEGVPAAPYMALEQSYIIHASYMGKSVSVLTENSRASDLRPNGGRFYILGRQTLNVIEYHLSESWNIESRAYLRELDISQEINQSDDPVPNGLYLRKDDGERMWILNRDEIWEYTLSTPWDVSSADQTGYRDLSSDIIRGHDIDFKPDGRVLYVDDRDLGMVFQYELGTPWDVSTATLDYVLDISNRQEEVRGIQLSSNGDRMYLMDTARREVLEYFLGTPYDLRSAVYIASFSVSSQTVDPRGLTFKPGLDMFYVTDATRDRVYQYRIMMPPDPELSDVSVSETRVQANGQNRAKVTVLVRDRNDDPVEGAVTELRARSGTLQVTPANVRSNSHGIAHFDVTNSTVEEVEYEAWSEGVEIRDRVSVQFIGIDPDSSTISIEDTVIQANGSDYSQITILVRDEYGEPFTNLEMELLPGGGHSMIEGIQPKTDSEGLATFRVTNTIPEQVTYSARGLGTTLSEMVTVNFIPIAPVALNATGIETDSFTANWELVEGADSYRLDVASDSLFSSFLPGYDNENIGHVTSHTIDNVQPGTTYYYQVRASVGGLSGADSKAIEVTTFPDIPVALEATERNALSLTANWEPADGARTYLLDVARDPDFTDILSGYENLNVGNHISAVVDGLSPGTSYFYRVRSGAGPRVSNPSNEIATSTLTISSEMSSINQEQLRVLANGNQSNEIIIHVNSDEGIALEGLRVALIPESGQSQVEVVQDITDEEGRAVFKLTNMQAETVTYQVSSHDSNIGSFEVEFLPDAGELTLGDNYPNPFQVTTTLPVNVPEAMNIEIRLYDRLGRPVQEVINEFMEPGYYEVPLNAAGLASGVYFYRLTTSDEIITRSMVLVK